MAEHQEDAPAEIPPNVSLATIASQINSLKRSIEHNGSNSHISERGKQARLQPGETLTANGPLRGYNRTLTTVEQLEAIERMLPADGEPLPPEMTQDVHEAIKKGAALLFMVALCLRSLSDQASFQNARLQALCCTPIDSKCLEYSSDVTIYKYILKLL